MLEPRIAGDAEDDSIIWIGVHKESALMDFLIRGEFQNADVELFREIVTLQAGLTLMPGIEMQLNQPAPIYHRNRFLTDFFS